MSNTSNSNAHLILRELDRGQNYDAASVADAVAALAGAGLPPRFIVDCSHGNSGKDYRRQPQAAAVAEQIAAGSSAICGVMLESHLIEGRQEIVDGRKNLRYGQSLTDGCLGSEETASVLDRLATAVRKRRAC